MKRAIYELVEGKVPHSTANLGLGFDTDSLALSEPVMTCSLIKTDTAGIEIVVHSPYSDEIPTNSGRHAGGKALQYLFRAFKIEDGARLVYHVEAPPRKGLGVSGAEAALAICNANIMYNLGLDAKKLVEFAAKGEPEEHMDNVAASIKGGYNIITKNPIAQELEIHNFKVNPHLGMVIIESDISKESTQKLREVLPSHIHKQEYIKVLGYRAIASIGFASPTLAQAHKVIDYISWDIFAEPARANAGGYGEKIDYSWLKETKLNLYQNYHVAHTISGAGPFWILWYIKEENEAWKRKRGKGNIELAIEYSKKRIEELGHKVKRAIYTKPTDKGYEILRCLKEFKA